MAKLSENQQFSTETLIQTLYAYCKGVSVKVNALASGRVSGIDGAYTAAPTTGTWAQGDFVHNSNPVEAGVALAKYIVLGWKCTVGGTPGTWLPVRTLTGN